MVHGLTLGPQLAHPGLAEGLDDELGGFPGKAGPVLERIGDPGIGFGGRTRRPSAHLRGKQASGSAQEDSRGRGLLSREAAGDIDKAPDEIEERDGAGSAVQVKETARPCLAPSVLLLAG